MCRDVSASKKQRYKMLKTKAEANRAHVSRHSVGTGTLRFWHLILIKIHPLDSQQYSSSGCLNCEVKIGQHNGRNQLAISWQQKNSS